MPFAPSRLEAAGFVDRALTQQLGDLTVSAAVLAPAEVEALLGIDLYAQGIQPLWLQAENRGDLAARVALWSIDDRYFAPLEVAWMNRKEFKRQDRAELDLWFYRHGMPRRIPAGETRSGFVFTNATTGTKSFNVDVYVGGSATSFTFFTSLPGFRPDYMDVDFESLYADDDFQSLDANDLEKTLAAQPCCSTDSSGTRTGAPFNVFIVGAAPAVRRALLRAGWEETEAATSETALASAHHYRGRIPDGTFHRRRPDGSGRRELRLWLAPLRVGDDLVWLGQAVNDISGARSDAASRDARVDPDVDDARMFVMQSFWYGQSLARMGLVGGVPPAGAGAPRTTFAGSEYFTDGQRAVLFVSATPVAMDETVLLRWAEPAAP